MGAANGGVMSPAQAAVVGGNAAGKSAAPGSVMMVPGVSGGAVTGGASGAAGSKVPGGSAGAGSIAGAVAAMSSSDSDAGVPTGSAMMGSLGTGPGDWKAGDYPPGLESTDYLEISGVPGQKELKRQYKVHVPPSYDPQVPTPVVFCIHGLGQDSVLFCQHGADMPAKSDAAGFILVMPNGYQNSWNGGTCCGAAADEGLDDIALMRAIFDEVAKHVNIDKSRVYATGLSNGGYMSYRLACEASDLFVAVAPGAGAVGMDDIGGGTRSSGDIKACKPTHKISLLAMHGTEDPLIPYRVLKPSIELISDANGCQRMTEPAKQPMSGGDTECVSYTGCPAGIDVTACSVMGGGHDWFGNKTCGTGVEEACAIVGANSDTLVSTDAVWDFFSKHTRVP
jgi:polyhydroxybutyrate depolymerase